MIFNLLRKKCDDAADDDAADTGTYADGAFEVASIEVNAIPRRLRGHIAHQRDYGAERTIVPIPSGFA